MSNLWATPLRDPRPNRRNGTMSKLQRRGDRSDAIYLTAKTPGFFAAASAASRESAERGHQAHEVSDDEEIGHDDRNGRRCYWRVARLQLV